MSKFKIESVAGGWWLLYEGVTDVWWHIHHNKWFAVFPTLEDVFIKIKEKT